MGKFNKGGRFGGDRGGRKFSGKRDFDDQSFDRGRDRQRPRGHKAICTDCGNQCEVPFRPTGDKPVFCSDCFRNHSDSDSRGTRDSGGRDFSRGDRGFGGRDRDSRPRFDNRRPGRDGGGRSSENYKSQFNALNAKLDRILKLLGTESNDADDASKKTKYKKYDKQAKKTVDTAGLNKILKDTLSEEKAVKPAKKKVAAKKTAKKAPAKKTSAKKPATKKAAKKASAKKAPAKKTVTKKTATKKPTSKKKTAKKSPAKKKK